MTYITKIETNIPHTEIKLDIELNGKDLIFIGNNGCGKTKLLRHINSLINDKLQPQKISYFKQLKHSPYSPLQKPGRGPIVPNTNNDDTTSKFRHFFTDESTTINWSNYDGIASGNIDIFTCFFEAKRNYNTSTLHRHNSLSSFFNTDNKININTNKTGEFEPYLVALYEAACIEFATTGDANLKNKVDILLENITNDLRYLFEDDTLTLKYLINDKKFAFKKHEETFISIESLSSGYSSILNIYTSLLMNTFAFKKSQREISGIVFIDEIDVHLHISLQRKILPFLKKSYPKVQFIVSTHSPFVLQSVDDTVIFDLNNHEQTIDVSMYSYQSIVKGLLGINTNSDIQTSIINELMELVNYVNNNNINKINNLVSCLTQAEYNLDTKSKLVILLAKEAILKYEESNNV